MAKRKSRGNNRGGPKSRGGGGFDGGRGRGAPPVDFDILDFPVQMWPESDSTYLSFASVMGMHERYMISHYSSGYYQPRGWGRGNRGRGYRGSRGPTPVPRTSTPSRGNSTFQPRTTTPSGGNGVFQFRSGTPSRGAGSAHGHPGIGRPGHQQQTKSKLGSSAPLSSLLYESRPLLRPVVFVKSTLTPVLFQQEEELLKPTMEDIGTCLVHEPGFSSMLTITRRC